MPKLLPQGKLLKPYEDNLEHAILEVSTTLFKDEHESAFYDLAHGCHQPSTTIA